LSIYSAFRPNPNDALAIDGAAYRFTRHPTAPELPYGQSGRRATVYQLAGGDALYALKVFTQNFRSPRVAAAAEVQRPFATLPGLAACARTVLTPERHAELLGRHPDLAYAVLMPWVEGETWHEVVASRRPLSPEQSHALAQSLAHILATMEHQGLAHCALAGPNVMVGGHGQAALVDLEDMYGPGLAPPEELPAGSPGYAHRTAPQGQWGGIADRFAGAVLLAEMLGWCDERVRQASDAGQFFDPGEVQHDGERYRTLLQSIRQRWGGALGDAFARAWHSVVLEDCPSFAEWVQHIAALQAVGSAPDREQVATQAPPAPVLPPPREQVATQAPLAPVLPPPRDAALRPWWRQGEKLGAFAGLAVILCLLGWITVQNVQKRAATQATATAQSLGIAASRATVDAQSTSIAGAAQQSTAEARTAVAERATAQAAAALGVTATAFSQLSLDATAAQMVLDATAAAQAELDATAAQEQTALALPSASPTPSAPSIVAGALEIAPIAAEEIERRRAAYSTLASSWRLLRQETFDSAQTKNRWSESRNDPIAPRLFSGSYQLTVSPSAPVNADLWREQSLGDSYIVELDVSLPTPGTWAGIIISVTGEVPAERLFAVSDLGTWQLITRAGGQADAALSTAAQPSGALGGASQINTLRLVRLPNELQLWANNTPLAAIPVEGPGGQVGVVGLADGRLGGPAIVHVDNFKVWAP
jgi:hypothetical protein